MALHRRVTLSLSNEIIQLIEALAPKSRRSSLVEQAILEFAGKRKKEELDRRLRDGYLANAADDLKMAREYYPLEQEAFEKGVIRKEKKNG